MLPPDHELAPTKTQYSYYANTAPTSVTVRGHIIATPEVTAGGLLTSYIIRPEPTAERSASDPVVPPDFVLGANPGIENHGGFMYAAIRQFHILES